MSANDKTTLEAELLFAIVKERYGGLLNDEQLSAVRDMTLAQHRLASALRATRLPNDVEPFSTFQPYRGDDNG